MSFYYLPRLSTSINKKIITIIPNLKCLSKLFLFCKFRSKKNYLVCSHLFFFTSFFWSTINKFIFSRNVLLTTVKTTKATFSRFLSILTTRACSLIFYFSALCFKMYLKLFYTYSWCMMVIERWLVFKISKYSHKALWSFYYYKLFIASRWLIIEMLKTLYKKFWFCSYKLFMF